MMLLLLIIILGSYVSLAENQPLYYKFPIRAPLTLLTSTSTLSCSSQPTIDIVDMELKKTMEILNNTYMLRPCQCGGPGWTRVLYLNMANSKNRCPSNWTLYEGTVRGCGRKSEMSNSCDSVAIPVYINYSIICGRISAYQKGASLAFSYGIVYNSGVEYPYVSGLSLTHGAVGERKHVWSFAGAWDEKHEDQYESCLCIDPTKMWLPKVPSYVNDSYFCDTGASVLTDNTVNLDNPLWDGEGCGGNSTCCSFNTPPWFCKALKYHTSDNLELRLCSRYSIQREDKLISHVEIYVK